MITHGKRTLISGSSLALLIASVGFILRTREQCPDSFTQAQVDAANCIVGASVGPMLNLRYALVVSILVLIVTIFLSLRSRN